MGGSEELFARAKVCIPGGVNSPVRAFGSVGMTPRFIARGASFTLPTSTSLSCARVIST